MVRDAGEEKKKKKIWEKAYVILRIKPNAAEMRCKTKLRKFVQRRFR